ncbi:MAG: hypothetical protein CFE62_005660 [Candidatus Aquirickettsiella gammari]|uniref:Uncharacterized protein n=1 Tax=Candidatus Aquirickettsiella gammari TaxID=2016198 RepID=A0A370CG92_9COXI|nr:MAG: hypothetical protein CFE62_005660 [Candidatus Aquirickettsiella gammari]
MAYSSLYSESKNNNNSDYSFFKDYQETFNNYFIFLNSLFAIPGVINISLENHSHAFDLIHHSQGLLKKLIANLTNTTLIEASVTHFFSTLTNVAFDLGLNAHSDNLTVSATAAKASAIEGMAHSLYNSVKNKVKASILTEAIGRYSLNLHDGNIEAAKQYCLDLFNQTCLDVPVVTTVQNIINNTVTTKNSAVLSTDLLSPETMRTEALVETTTLASYAPQNVTLSSYNNTRNETEIDVSLDASNYLIPPTPELIAVAGHGIVNGVSNALSQHVSERLSSPDYSGSRTTAAVLNLVSILVHSGYAAAFPLILASLENADISDDNAKDEMWERITQQVIPSFFTNLGFSLGFQVLNHYHTHYLSGFPTVKAALQSIPVVSTACAAISAPIATGVNIGTAVISSFLTKTALNRFFSLPKKGASKLISAKEEAEMSLILNENNSISNSNATPSSVNDANLLEEPIYFLKSKQLEIVKENLTTVITHLKNMSDVYIQGNTTIENHKKTLNTAMKEMKEKNIIISCTDAITEHEENFINNEKKLKIINTQKSKLEQFNELLSDDIHLNACIGFVSAEALVKDVNVQNLWALMKTMIDQKIMEELEQALCSINGIDSKKLIICPESTEPNKQLEAHMSTIRNNSSLVRSVLQGAVRIYDAKQQGVTAAKKVSASYASGAVISATLRKDNNNGGPNRRHTVTLCSSASDDSNSSITLSTISASSAYDPVKPQQKQPLLRPS